MASSSGRSHVDVNERRLRPIYDCLDNGNNKKAIQEADRILKKQRDFACAKALKALALIRLSRHDESTPLLQEVHSQQPHDEPTLQAMAMCYRELYKLDLIADIYENAYKKKPESEEILNSLFMAYVRIGNYKKQQQVAMVLHKLRPQKNPYYFWAVMSIVMQAYENEKLGKTMFLPLAEKMVQKFINEGRLEAEAEVRIYLIILQSMGKHKEALDLLQGPLAEKLTSEPDFPQFLEVELLTKLEKWSLVNAAYKMLIKSNPDHWQCYKEYLHSSFILLDSKRSTEDGNINCSDVAADDSIEQVAEFLSAMVKSDKDSREGKDSLQAPYPLRGPYLAQLELLRLLKERDDSTWDKVLGSPLELICQYYSQYGDKPCCFPDLRTYIGLLSSSEQRQMIFDLLNKLGVHNKDSQAVMATDTKAVQRHLLLLQLSRFVGFHNQMTSKECLVLVGELLQRYNDGLKFGEALTITDQQYVDNYILLVVHLLCDVASSVEDDQYIWYALVLLEKSLTKSSTNFQLKLLAIQLYARIGAFLPCLGLYESLEIKHIQHDTLGYIVCNHVLRLGHLSSAHTILDNILRFFASVHKDTSDYLISSYKYGSFPKVQEFVRLRSRLQNSLQFASSTAEKLLLDIISNTSSHKMTLDIVNGMDIDPRVEQTDFDGLCDNRDCSVMLSWEPGIDAERKELNERSFLEEKKWLHVRNLIARCLLAAVKLGGASTGGAAVPAPAVIGNGNDAKVVRSHDVLVRLREELSQCLSDAEEFIKPYKKKKDIYFGPYPTLLAPYVKMGLGCHLLSGIDLLLSSELRQTDQQETQERTHSSASVERSQQSLINLIQENKRPVVLVDGERRQFMVEALESLVLLAEHISQVTVILGACHEILKPMKVAMTKKGKKRKESNPHVGAVFEDYDQLLSDLLLATKDLLSSFFEVFPGDDLVFQLDALKIEDVNPLLEVVDKPMESFIRGKVMTSYQTSAVEIKTLLNQKQRYLESLRL